ncbi:MAG: hypothetical protein ACQETO_07150 [Pseudomonadota bacterium]
MRKSVYFGYGCLLMLWMGAVRADTPVYDEQTRTLTVPVVEVDGQPGRFQDVVLEPDGNGGWVVARLEEGVLLDSEYVESFGMSATGHPIVQRNVNLSGTFPNGCPEIGRVTQRVEGDTIELFVYYAINEWLRDPDGVACTQALVPFDLSIPLDTRGLEAGDYNVRVNGHYLVTFTVQESELFRPFAPLPEREDCEWEPELIQDSAWVAHRCRNTDG